MSFKKKKIEIETAEMSRYSGANGVLIGSKKTPAFFFNLVKFPDYTQVAKIRIIFCSLKTDYFTFNCHCATVFTNKNTKTRTVLTIQVDLKKYIK